MKQYRWVALALSAGLLTGCPGLTNNINPNTISQLNALLGEYGLSLKTVDPTTGEAKTYAEADITSVKDEKGNKIDYKFEGGKLVFRPVLEGNHKIFVTLKDGTTQQFTIEGKKTEKADERFSGDVAFIPDSSGQGYTTEVGIGTTIDVEARHDAFLNQMAAKRVKVTFGGGQLTGLSAASIKAVYLDHQKAPHFAYEVTSEGALKLDPPFFFLAKQYYEHRQEYPLLRVAYLNGGTLTVIVAKLTSLPKLPDMPKPQPGSPPPIPPGPDQFEANQTLDVAVAGSETPTDLATYEQQTGLQGQLPPPGGFQPTDPNQDAFRQQMLANAITLPVVLPTGSKVGAYWVGRMMRPGMDVLEVTSTGVKVDPMLFLQLRAYQVAVLKNDTTFPWVRLAYAKATGGWEVTRFRLKNPTWWTTFKSSFTLNVPTDFVVPATASADPQLAPQPPVMVPFFPPPPETIETIKSSLSGISAADLEVVTEPVPSNITDPMQFNATLQYSNNP